MASHWAVPEKKQTGPTFLKNTQEFFGFLLSSWKFLAFIYLFIYTLFKVDLRITLQQKQINVNYQN